MKKYQCVLVALAALTLISSANATSYPMNLQSVTWYYTSFYALKGNLAGTALNGWIYDDVAHTVTAPGLFQDLFKISPPYSMYTNTVDGLVLSTNGSGGLTQLLHPNGYFTCAEGTYGGVLQESFCGRYGFGADGNDDSTATWGPHFSYSRTLLGDDVYYGPVQSVGNYDDMSLISFDGTNLVIGNTNSNADLGNAYTGYVFRFGTVPLPAGAGLFGCALAALAGVGRKRHTGESGRADHA